MTHAEPHDYQVVDSRTVYTGKLFALRTDEVRMPGGVTARREVLVHPGAVIIVPVDDAGQVVLVRQYRHPIGEYLWEVPAGLLDVDGELALDAARRELREEAHLTAGIWNTLLDVVTSPGISQETCRVYLARDLSPVPDGERYRAEHDEEAEMEVDRVDLDQAVERALAGDLRNAATVAGILAAARARDNRWIGVRPADAPWPAKPDRV